MTEERDVLSAEQRLLNAFDYAQGFDVAGWEGHLPKESVRIKFIAALDVLRACLDETRRERDSIQVSLGRMTLRAEAEVAALRRERDEAVTEAAYQRVHAKAGWSRVEAAEAECEDDLVYPCDCDESDGSVCLAHRVLSVLSAPVSTPNSQKGEGA